MTRYPSLYPQNKDDDDESELARTDARQKRYQNELRRHPDPRDPDYPGDINEWRETV